MTRRWAAVAAMLVLAVAPRARAAPTPDLVRCQKGIHLRAEGFAKAVETALSNCAYKVESCQLGHEIDGGDATACLAAATATCAGLSAKIPSYRSLYASKALAACTVSVADVAPWIGGLGMATNASACGAGTMSDLVTCLFAEAQCSAERTVFVLDPRAEDALTTAGIAAAHPCVAP